MFSDLRAPSMPGAASAKPAPCPAPPMPGTTSGPAQAGTDRRLSLPARP
jgi:hypothetical protein